jgi:GH15 family glucan-1,4-alpha-glucosidase
MRLIDFLNDKFNGGILYTDAVHVCLGLYCSLDFLPKDVDTDNLTKEKLSECFSNLSSDKKIISFEKEVAEYFGVYSVEFKSREHWSEIISSITKKGRSYDSDLVEGILK